MERHNTQQKLPTNLYLAQQVRELDRIAIEQENIAGFTLMRRAGKIAFDTLLDTWPNVEKITVFCGVGNNGGDGYVLAILAMQYGIVVNIVQCGNAEKITGDALQARQLALQDGVDIVDFDRELHVDHGVIVDALLGTGLSGDVRADFAQAIDCMNSSQCPVLAIDIPSGLCSDTGQVLGKSVYAEQTVSFIGFKQGLLTGCGPDYTGRVTFSELSVPPAIFQQVEAASQRLDFDELMAALSPRQSTAHKGHFGHVMIAGGDTGMAGAAIMASQSACRVGAGLVSCTTRPEHIPAINSRCPEVMAHGVMSGQEIEPLLERATVVVIGPGLGQGAWGEQLLQKVFKLSVPMVVDADALNIIADGRVVTRPYKDNWILTPHPGEAARLLGCSSAEIQRDRFAAVAELQRRYGGAVILKGAGTLVADAEIAVTGVCPYGNPGMATGGMGDVLSGILGALLAQGLSPGIAARLGVCLHGKAGDMASASGQRGMMATDLITHLQQLVN